MRIILNGPSSKMKNKGGVANHIHGLKKYWTIDVRYNVVGQRIPKPQNGKYWIVWDVIKFIFKLFLLRPDAVWINPSIGKNALRRDFIFLNIAHKFGIKVIVFIHGFNLENFKNIDKNWLRNNLNKAALILVLAKDFKNRLREIGVTVPIELTTTKVEDSLVSDFNIENKDYKNTNKLLFLARVEKEKGIYETIDTFALLKKDFPNLSLQISGGGKELIPAQDYVKKNGIKDVTFTGFITENEIKDAYSSALLLLLLTSHGEGMPTNVLEGMAFGLPIITRPVGGLDDFFQNNMMGFISSSLQPEDFAKGIRPLIENRELLKKIGVFNYNYAKEHFYASKVANDIESLLKKYIK